MRIILFLTIAIGAVAQGPQFEVASVRRSSPDSRVANCAGGPGTNSPTRFSCEGISLVALICYAYDLQFYQVEGAPDWANSGGPNGYTLNANLGANATKEEFRSMLQALLIERFGLEGKLDKLPRPTSAIVSGGKPRLTRSESTTERGLQPEYLQNGAVRVTMRHQSMSVLAGFLTTVMRGPVTDQTRIEGTFDFTLEFAPDFVGAFRPPSAADDSVPLLSTALDQQLGLKLIRTTAPLDVFVVSKIRRDPGQN